MSDDLEPRPDWWRPPRPPFEPGNTLAVTHGADSERSIEARAQLVRASLFEMCPQLADRPEYAPAVARFLRAESRALLLHDHIIEVTSTRGAGKVAVRLWEQVTAADRLAAQLGNVLGLDPLGRAKLQRETADAHITSKAALAGLAADGAEILRSRAANSPAQPLDATTTGDEPINEGETL